jgi:condensin complex subunit 2
LSFYQVPEEEPQLTDPNEAREFTEVITGLRNSYPNDKMDEISTSFCFICLLHLANEEGLQINDPDKEESKRSAGLDANEEEFEGVETKVGDIWSLKVIPSPELVVKLKLCRSIEIQMPLQLHRENKELLF